MTFTVPQVMFLQRLVSERPVERGESQAGHFFCDHFSVGVAVGRRINYRAAHFEAAENLLRSHDLPVTRPGPGATRSESAVYGGMSEKAFSVAPHAGSIAVKCIGNCALDGRTLTTPEGAYLVLTPALAERVVCQRLMLVENLETFRDLETYRWVDLCGIDTLVVYRGDVGLPTKNASALVQRRAEPIWGFFDFDPAGLAMANALPPGRLERIVLPSLAWLKESARTARGRQLFDDQEAVYGPTLDRSEHPQVRTRWAQLRSLRSAVTQERMVCAETDSPAPIRSD